jgi:hypothetical protein
MNSGGSVAENFPAGPTFWENPGCFTDSGNILAAVKVAGQVLGHADDRQMDSEFCDKTGKTEPAIHQEVVCANPQSLRPFDHILKQIGGFGHGLLAAFISASPLVECFLDALNPVGSICRRPQNKIKRQKGGTIIPAEGQQLEAFEIFLFFRVVIKYLRQQLDRLGTASIIIAVVNDQHLLSFLAGQQVKRHDNFHRQTDYKPAVCTTSQPSKSSFDALTAYFRGQGPDISWITSL